ncbi:MAG: glycosyltransferase family 2 protein [Planctomycetota bacterium]
MKRTARALTALPVFNEAKYVDSVLHAVKQTSAEILVVDDGSSDATAEILSRRDDIHVVTHAQNQGYGAALRTAFQYAMDADYDVLVTIDCDGQHEPKRIPRFVEACEAVDIVSGSRYLQRFEGDSSPPPERQNINRQITDSLNQRLGLEITDAFCGFKAYRVDALRELELHETGYAMPLELWVQAATRGFRIRELAVPLIYLDEDRSFGGVLDDAESRKAYYHQVINTSLARVRKPPATCRANISGESAGCH